MKKLLYILILIPALTLAQAPTQSQNYVLTRAYKDSTKTTDVTKAKSAVTYLDGLGRPVQQVLGQASAEGKDIITHIEYDPFNRQPKQYLPYQASGSGLQFDGAAKANTLQFYSSSYYENTPNPYNHALIEPSPLGRVLKQAAPGTAWQMDTVSSNDHTIKFEYRTNGEQEVRRLRAQATWNNATQIYDIAFYDDGFCAPSQLYKTITKDENWTQGLLNTTEEFKNKQGQVVLKRTYAIYEGNTEPQRHDTYYVYDQYGNLTYVLPPLAEGQPEPELCYFYKYDHRNRLVEKKLPGKQWEYIVYDNLDRIISTGPALSPWGEPQEGWMYNYYDASGRQCMGGWYPEQGITSAARKALQDLTEASVVNVTRGASTIDNITTGYTLPWLPSGFKLLTINYYDTYHDNVGPAANTQVEGQELLTKYRGLTTGRWVRVLTAPDQTFGETAYTWYDKYARPVRTYTANYLGGFTQVDTKLDFDGTPQYTITTHSLSGADTPIVVKDMFTYTPEDRLLSHTHQINSDPVQLLSLNSYDALGQLKTKKVGGIDLTGAVPLQKVDFSYNIRGWMKGINDIAQLSPDSNENDLFAFKINYNDALTENVEGAVRELYNGNIAETYWRSSSDNVLRKYGYKYDNLNRLLHAYYQKPGSAPRPVKNSYDEKINYDKNGNILNLLRKGDYDDDITTVTIDDLVYTYHATNKNQLLKVSDEFTNNPSGFADSPDNVDDDYTYDLNGNMKTDRNKGITSIKYNHLNLPVEIVFGNSTSQSLRYLYTAAGVKRSKTVSRYGMSGSLAILTTDTYYFDGFQYTSGHLQYFPTAEGYVDNVKLSANVRDVFNYVFQYKDHLGNIRMNYAVDPADNVLKIKEENHYYPFGLKHSNYNSEYLDFQEEDQMVRLLSRPPGGGFDSAFPKHPYKYKYQEQERQEELGLNWDSFKWRNYDYTIGRFMSIDPLTEKYNTWSPYTFSGNRVIDARELEGLEPYILFKTESAALRNFGQQYNGKSIKQGVEYGANVYKKTAADGNTYYYYDKPNKGDEDGVSYPLTWFKEGKRTSTIHTHGEYLPGYDNNEFSPADKKNAENRGVDNHVVTPDGSLKKYDVETNKESVIDTNMPSDPKDPDRKNNVAPNENPKPVDTKPIEPKKDNNNILNIEYHHGRIM